MKKINILIAFILLSGFVKAQLVSIATARTYSVGAQVTITGVCMNGQELGNIRYIDDGTGSIAVFSTQINGMVRGDAIMVTGTLSDYFGLLEVTNLTSFQFFGGGNNLPAPIVTTPAQLSESTESHLVRIDGVVFTNGGGVFAGNANYSFTANGETGLVRIAANTNLVGTAIPSAAVSVIALCSQYQTTYQLLPRDINDIFLSLSFYLTSVPVQQNVSSTGFDVTWTTNLPGSTFIKYGLTPNLELGQLNGSGGSINHTVTIAGASPAQVYYVKAYSVNGSDTAFSNTRIFITASLSSGDIKVYFNKSVNNSYAWNASNYAITLQGKFQDTIAAYIDRAQNTIDLAIYNFDSQNTGLISQAINNAYNRGVAIRIIYDGGNANNALSLLNGAIPKLPSPTTPPGYYTIMHNKFMIIDAGNASRAMVITGSTNFTNAQLNTDANSLIIIQDQSLAKGYMMEFEEMWGSNNNTPNATNAKFGPDKTDNTPHEYVIGGNRVESYFSPSDNVNNQIMNAVNTSDYEMQFALLVFTRFDVAYVAENRITNFGVDAYGLVDDTGSGGGQAYNILATVMGSKLMLYNHGTQSGLLHHKYLIVDQSHPSSDPLVLVGSHNWSTTANQKNDENTLVIHNRDIANQYYQEFVKRFTDNGGVLKSSDLSNDITMMLYPNPANEKVWIKINSGVTDSSEFILYDTSGRKLLQQTLRTGVNQEISLKNVNRGLYLYQISGHQSVISGKLMVQ
jgi:phosphatidylserine/phosphatidylglycerophosphate/cardiolipin synthase-like enzyme